MEMEVGGAMMKGKLAKRPATIDPIPHAAAYTSKTETSIKEWYRDNNAGLVFIASFVQLLGYNGKNVEA